MTKEQRKTVRHALWWFGKQRKQGNIMQGVGKEQGDKWQAVIADAVQQDEHGQLLVLRYIEGLPEDTVIALLHVGRTTYLKWHAEAISTVAVLAAREGLL